MGKRKRDIKWSDVRREEVDSKANPRVTCNYCKDSWQSSSVQRIDEHMGDCGFLPLDLYPRYGRDASTDVPRKRQAQLPSEAYTITKTDQKACDALLAEAIYSSGVAFNFVSIE